MVGRLAQCDLGALGHMTPQSAVCQDVTALDGAALCLAIILLRRAFVVLYMLNVSFRLNLSERVSIF